MSAIVAGKSAAIEQGFSYRVSRTAGAGGTESWRTWAGTPSAVIAQFNSLRSNPAVTEVEAEQGAGSALATVRARFSVIPGSAGPGGAAIQESLSIRWIDVSPELHRNPAFINITSARIKALEDEISKTGGGTAPTDATELEYYRLRVRGVQTYKAKLPVVTYARTAPRSTSETLNVSASGKIAPLVTVPVSSFFVLSDINLGFSSDSLGTFTAGWMIQADGDYLANGSSHLVETYEFGLWETALYDFTA